MPDGAPILCPERVKKSISKSSKFIFIFPRACAASLCTKQLYFFAIFITSSIG